jgi:hypothetical protein
MRLRLSILHSSEMQFALCVSRQSIHPNTQTKGEFGKDDLRREEPPVSAILDR